MCLISGVILIIWASDFIRAICKSQRLKKACVLSTIKISILVMGFLSSVLIDYTVFKVRYIAFEILTVALFQAFVNENGSYYFLSFYEMS